MYITEVYNMLNNSVAFWGISLSSYLSLSDTVDTVLVLLLSNFHSICDLLALFLLSELFVSVIIGVF